VRPDLSPSSAGDRWPRYGSPASRADAARLARSWRIRRDRPREPRLGMLSARSGGDLKGSSQAGNGWQVPRARSGRCGLISRFRLQAIVGPATGPRQGEPTPPAPRETGEPAGTELVRPGSGCFRLGVEGISDGGAPRPGMEGKPRAPGREGAA